MHDELVGSQSFLYTNFIHIFQRCSSLGKDKTVVFFHLRFFFTTGPMTIHHTALKNHRMCIVLQQTLNLIFNITTLLC